MEIKIMVTKKKYNVINVVFIRDEFFELWDKY